MKDKIGILAKGRSGKILLEVLDEVTKKVADIRNEVPAKAEIENDVRRGVIAVIERFLITPIRVAGGVVEPPIRGDAKEYE